MADTDKRQENKTTKRNKKLKINIRTSTTTHKKEKRTKEHNRIIPKPFPLYLYYEQTRNRVLLR